MDQSGQERQNPPFDRSPLHFRKSLPTEESGSSQNDNSPGISEPSSPFTATSVRLPGLVEGTALSSDAAHGASMEKALPFAKSAVSTAKSTMNNLVVMAARRNDDLEKSSMADTDKKTSNSDIPFQTPSDASSSTAKPIATLQGQRSLGGTTGGVSRNANHSDVFPETGGGAKTLAGARIIRHALLVGYKQTGENGELKSREEDDRKKSPTSTREEIDSDEEKLCLRLESNRDSLSAPSAIPNNTKDLVADDREKNFLSNDQNGCTREYSTSENFRTFGESSFADGLACGSKMVMENETSGDRNPQNNAPIYKSFQSSAEVDGSECYYNLQPAPVPHDPINDEWAIASPLERELAWLVEESAFILSNSATNDEKTKNSNRMRFPLILEFAWNHASLHLREQILAFYPEELMTVLTDSRASRYVALVAKKDNLDQDRFLIDSLTLLSRKLKDSNTSSMAKQSTVIETVDVARFTRLLDEARNALVLGYRRNNSIGEVLDDIHKERWRDAVGEIGEPDIKRPRHLKTCPKRLHRTKSKILSFGGDISQYWSVIGKKACDPFMSSEEIRAKNLLIARNVPKELTDLEEEMAWLCEESLILLGEDIIGSDSIPNGNISSSSTFSADDDKVIVSETSAGLVTQAPDVNWKYVVDHASPPLKKVLDHKNVLSLQSRILKRVIRYHDSNVKNAFWKRRDDVAGLILIGGYRRHSTQKYLPSHELLVQIGRLQCMAKVFTVRRMRWRNFQYDENLSSSEELRFACNVRIGNKNGHRNNITKNPKHNGKKRRLAVDNLPRTNVCSKTPKPIAEKSILTAEEEEIAWLREEYEIETGGLKGFDWEYIEEFASPILLDTMTKKGVTLSKFPTKPGVSKLLKMVRLKDPDVEKAFWQKRIDVRHAIVKRGFRRNLLSKKLPVIPKAPEVSAVCGTQVFDIQVPGVESMWESTKISFKEKWQCDICGVAVFDTFEEAAEHEQNCSFGSHIMQHACDYVWQCIGCKKRIGEDFDSIFNHERNCNCITKKD
ncbi:hypothetical protein ACHAXS_013414 [Conticribra weissflogii]